MSGIGCTMCDMINCFEEIKSLGRVAAARPETGTQHAWGRLAIGAPDHGGNHDVAGSHNRGLFHIEHPILLAPMAGPSTAEFAIAVSDAGGLGWLACALSTPEQIRTALGMIRQRTTRPINLNFFTHSPPISMLSARPVETAAQRRLPRLGIDKDKPVPRGLARRSAMRPAISSRSSSRKSSVSTSACRRSGSWSVSRRQAANDCLGDLSEGSQMAGGQGRDAIIAQGYEAGGIAACS